jgi:PAS domain S-box-containing protein
MAPEQEIPAPIGRIDGQAPALECLLENVQEAVIAFDREWRCTYVNRAAVELAGKPAAAPLGKCVWEVFPKAVGRVLHTELLRAASERRRRRFEEHFPSIDRWLEADAYPSNDGLVVIVRDITASKKHTLAVRNGEERLRLALSFGKMGVWEYDFKTPAIQWSPEREVMQGLAPGRFDGRLETAASLIHPDDRDGLIAEFRNAVKSQRTLAYEFRVIWPDGSIHHLYSRGKVVNDENGEAAMMLGVTIEITDQKRASEELQNRLGHLQLLSDLAGAVNHAQDPGEIYRAAAEGLVRVIGADRASVVIFDADDTMRFKAWIGLSDEYRSALEGHTHTPWRPGSRDAQPIPVADVTLDPSLSDLHPILAREGIRAVAFIPLLGNSGLIGKFMLYYDAPHEFRAEELQVAQTIATHVAFATERQFAERALRDSEERFRATFFQAAVGIAHQGLSGEWLLVNDRLCEMLGYTRAELRGITFLDITHPDDRETCAEALRRLRAGEASSYSTEKRYVRKDGSIIWVKLFVAPVRDRENRLQYFIGIVEDITDKIQVEGALRESERRLALALSTAHLGVWNCDLRDNSLVLSPAYSPVFGGGPLNPLTYAEWSALIHPDDRDRVLALARESLERTHTWEAEFRVLWPDETFRWIYSKAAVLLDDTGPGRMVGVSLDITERKETEAAMRASEQRFRNMADTAPVMIWVAGTDKVCTFFNKTWLDFTGRTPEQDMNNGWTESVHPDDRDRCFASYSSAFDARLNFAIEYRLRRADGEYRWVLCSGVPHFAPGGVFGGYIGSDIDITEVKRAQDEALSRQKLESLGVLTSGIAHDFNNLLGSILAEAELAEAELAADASPREEILAIKGVAIRASEIVRELMIYSGQDKANLEPVDVSRLVEEMLGLLKLSISKNAVLNTDLRANLPPVRGNAAQIRQIVMNLIINASEAIGEKDGLIQVITSVVHTRPTVALEGAATLPEGDYLRLEVSDNGCGMTEETRRKIFDPFFSTKFAGRGLGLAVVQGAVRAHGGAIDLMSAPGRGTSVQILFPCDGQAAQSPPTNTVPAAAGPIPCAAGTVLLVEDEDILRISVSKMLAKKGFCVIEAADGSNAIELFRNRKDDIDVILLDMTIPGASSREVLEEAHRLQPEVKVILTSAYNWERASHGMDASRIKGFIRKPFELVELLQLLRDTITSPAGARRLQ